MVTMAVKQADAKAKPIEVLRIMAITSDEGPNHTPEKAFRSAQLVLCFRNNVPMASGCIIDFVPPGVDDWLAIDVADEGHQAFPEFVFGGDADVAQH